MSGAPGIAGWTAPQALEATGSKCATCGAPMQEARIGGRAYTRCPWTRVGSVGYCDQPKHIDPSTIEMGPPEPHYDPNNFREGIRADGPEDER